MREKVLMERATPREIAVELEKLRAVFGYRAWQTAVGLYMDALADLPADLLREAVSLRIRRARDGDHFPKPGELRAIVEDELQSRLRRLEEQTNAEAERWPQWLADIWGPVPDGPKLRQQHLENSPKR